jgi:hypothetical protein
VRPSLWFGCGQRLRCVDSCFLSPPRERRAMNAPSTPPSAPAASSRVPEDRNIVAPDSLIARYQYKTLNPRLSNQRPVKRIVMVPRQAARRDGVGRKDLQRVEAHAEHDVVKALDRKFQPAERVPDRNFPRCDSTDENPVVRRRHRRTRLLIEPGRSRDRPDEGVSTEQRVQPVCPSNACLIPSGSGSSKSAPTSTSPASRPSGRGAVRVASDTSRTRGRPALAMTISSPRAARSTNCDRFVLASRPRRPVLACLGSRFCGNDDCARDGPPT